MASAIQSVLAQTFEDFEILVIDDGSTDASCDVVSSIEDPRIRLVRNDTHLGIPATRNRGADLARGEYLAFLDSDDEAAPDRLEKQVRFLDAHPDHAAVGSWIQWIDEEGQRNGGVKGKATESAQIRAERLFRSCLENSAATARTEVLRKIRHREHLELGSDYDLWARVADEHEIACLPEALVRRRQHTGRTTSGREDRIKALRQQIYGEMLAALGVRCTQADLERHYLLRRMHKIEFQPDAAYLRWAEGWLTRLKAANSLARRYPEPEFSQVLGGFWGKACWHAAPRAWGPFVRSPLCRDTFADSWGKLRRYLLGLFASRRG